jgi:alpha-tubulin suppressor-like RCC1 family protein
MTTHVRIYILILSLFLVSSQSIARDNENQFKEIKNGGNYSCAVNLDGEINCWGKNDYGKLGADFNGDFSIFPVKVSGITGQLGNGTFENSSSPKEVLGVDSAIGISMGYANACAVLMDGTIKCWGRNNVGEYGNVEENRAVNFSAPVHGLERIKQVSVGGSYCALNASQAAYCWGSNYYGQLGNGVQVDSPWPLILKGIHP